MDSRRRVLRMLGLLPLGSLPFLSLCQPSSTAANTSDEQGFYTIQIFRDGPNRYGYRITVQNLWEFERRHQFDTPELAMDEATKRCIWCWKLDKAV